MDDLEGIPKPGNWLPVLLLALVILPIVMCLSSHRSVGGIGAMLMQRKAPWSPAIGTAAPSRFPM